MRTLSKPASLVLALCAACIAQAASAQALTRAQQIEQARLNGEMLAGESGLTAREQFPGNYPAVAKPQGLSRAQVEAELAAAIASGDVFVGGESGRRANEFMPGYAPNAVANSGTTREQVRQALMDAIRTGDVVANGESGLTRRELSPGLYDMRRVEVAGSPANSAPH